MNINKNSEIPLYIQVAEHIKNMVRYGYYEVGTRISVRGISAEFGISKSVAENAIDLLKSENFVDSRSKSGTYISGDVMSRLMQGSPDWYKLSSMGAYQANRDVMKQAAIRNADRDCINLGAYSFEHSYYNPYEPVNQAMQELLGEDHHKILARMDFMGLPELREAVVEHCKNRGIKADTSNVVVFNIWYQALNAIAHSFLYQGMNTFMSKYDVVNSMGMVSTLGTNIYYADCDSDGIIPGSLNTLIASKRRGLAYIAPVNHWATGATLPAKRRDELLHVIQKHETPVVELDLLRDLWIEPPPPPLKTDDAHDQIIYVGAMANVFNVASQSAWVVAPKAIVERLADVKLQLYGATLHMNELMSWKMLSSGGYDRCMQRIRGLLPQRVDTFDAILHKHLDGIATWEKQNINYHAWIKFNQNIDTDRIFLDCKNVFFNTGSLYHDASRSHLLLSTNTETPENIESGVSQIASAAIKQLR